MKLTCALVAGFVEKQHLWVGVFTSTLDGLITALVNDAVEFSLQEQLCLVELLGVAFWISDSELGLNLRRSDNLQLLK